MRIVSTFSERRPIHDAWSRNYSCLRGTSLTRFSLVLKLIGSDRNRRVLNTDSPAGYYQAGAGVNFGISMCSSAH
jgi:hypothetical protein